MRDIGPLEMTTCFETPLLKYNRSARTLHRGVAIRDHPADENGSRALDRESSHWGQATI